MSDAPKPPQRAVTLTLTLTIGADSDEELGRAIEQFYTQWATNQCAGNGACGGVTYGWDYHVDRDPTMTHERYVSELRAWIEWDREQRRKEREIP